MSNKAKGLSAFCMAVLLVPIAGLVYHKKHKPPVIIYPSLVSAQPSTNFEVAIDGQPVFVQDYQGISFVRFAFSGSAKLAISASEPIASYRLSPKNAGIDASVDDRTITFVLTKGQPVVLRKVNSLSDELFILPDSPEINPPLPGVHGVLDASTQPAIHNTNVADDSAPGINSAISKLSSAGGGTLYLPAGVYNLRSAVNLKSGVNLYLAPGAVLQLASDYECCLQNQGLINFIDVNNARLTGRGIVNGNAINIPKQNRDFHLVVTEHANNIAIRDVLLMDEGDAALRLVDVVDAAVRNIKIIVHRQTSGADGIDIDSSQRVLIDNAFIYSSDDSTALHGGTGLRKTIKDNTDIAIQNSVFYNTQTGAAFKIGTEDAQKSINNVTWKNIDVVSCMQAAAFYPTYGANIENISLEEIRVEEVADRLFEFQAVIPTWDSHWTRRLGSIRDVHLANFDADARGNRASSFSGTSSSQDVSAIRFTNFRLAGSVITNRASAQIDFGPFVSNVSFSR